MLETKLDLFYYPDAELVFGLVAPIGIDYRPLVESLKNYLSQFGYSSNEIKISDSFDEIAKLLKIDSEAVPYSGKMASMWQKIQLGDKICGATKQKDVLALIAASEIQGTRERGDTPEDPRYSPRTAHIIISLKRPEEVATLRRIYGTGFFLIGLAASDIERQHFFEERGLTLEDGTKLVETDAAEDDEFGQRTRDTYYLSDVFISLGEQGIQIARFLDLVFGCPFKTPTLDERSMYMAYAASLSSGDLARQVGAVLMDEHGDCLGLGWNEVPKPGGGLYGPEPGSKRDMDRGEDSNDAEKFSMAVAIIQKFRPDLDGESARNSAKALLADTGFFDITEFGRAVHAEMAAILACSRTGRSPRYASLYVTTFPCHNCTRHIIASGIDSVFYIEPYPKSKALKLHGDACTEIKNDKRKRGEGKIPFLPFIGIGPRRYLDLFSLSLGTGYPIERKRNGKKVSWDRQTATPRLQMAPVPYLVREVFASTTLKELLSAKGSDPNLAGATNDFKTGKPLGSNQSSS
ncbi:MAG TPA: anti-phage dCTP deaminase [Edaphobacter sp.]|nr:anti-phage dCTP deaminase [Edaphobacter sp.]